ncbi:MAG: hydroxyacylglutathione hydrolase [Clostridiales bacterium]|nr:hydroxyacylglutathione hydrolase [Clostridiales bacterium]
MNLNHIKGNTYCIDTGMSSIPVYKLDDENVILLDTGWANGERVGLELILEENKWRVAGILASHAHIDHIGNNAYFQGKYGTVIGMARNEAMTCSSLMSLKAYYSGHAMTDIERHFGHMVCKTDVMIEPEDHTVELCGATFGVFHTPGHSPAHTCLITPDDVAYLGDALISYEVMAGAKMPYDFVLKEDLESKARLKTLKASQYIVAHKGVFTNIDQLIDDNINFYKERAERVFETIDGAMTVEDIFKAVVNAFSIHVKTKFGSAVIERMLRSYIEYMVDEKRLEVVLVNGMIHYKPV